MRRWIAMGVLGLGVAAWPSAGAAAGVEVRLGAFVPNAGKGHVEPCSSGCDLFQDLHDLFGADKSGWTGVAGGIEISTAVAENFEVGLTVDGYSRRRSTAYVDYTDNGNDITQDLTLSTVPVGVLVRFLPLGVSDRSRISPYVSVGGSLVTWQYTEDGDFIDFTDDTLPYYYDYRKVTGVTPGVFVAGGVRIPLNYDFALTAEGRYQWANDSQMPQPFEVYKLDLSGASATVGLMLRF